MTSDLIDANNQFTKQLDIDYPIICGPMYPCSNPELVAAVSKAGGIGIVQPISLTYVHGHDFRSGLQLIHKLAKRPVGMNALIERSSKSYHEKMVEWVSIALEEGIRFFITSLGNPKWVVDRVHMAGGTVYHDVTEKKWAQKGLDAGVDGLIAVNNRAGGHAGAKDMHILFDELKQYGVPLIAAGGIATKQDIRSAMQIGYSGVQMGTRFIATLECKTSPAYKQAIVESSETNIVLSERITGVPVSIINTPYVQKMGTKSGVFARWMLRGARTKRWMRMFYALRSLRQLKKTLFIQNTKHEYWQAGKSVSGIDKVQSVSSLMQDYATLFKLSTK